MRRLLSICCTVCAAVWLSACGGRTAVRPSLGGDTLDLKYAANLVLVDYGGCQVATLRNPWDTLRTLHT